MQHLRRGSHQGQTRQFDCQVVHQYALGVVIAVVTSSQLAQVKSHIVRRKVLGGGVEVKISKRAGSYVTLRDLVEWTSKDAVRFFLLSRKPDTEYTFDVDLAVAKNNDNPVYYVQYAHARICSVLAAWGGERDALGGVDLSPLTSPQAQALMLLLAKYPEMLTAAAQDFAPHDVTFYLRELAACYHSYYDAERILVDDLAVKLARLALVAATAQVLQNGLAVLGVDAPQKM